MLIATPGQKGVAMTVIEGVPLLVIGGVLYWLRRSAPGEKPGHTDAPSDRKETTYGYGPG